MVFILGVNFPEHRFVWRALETFFGVGSHTRERIMSRFYLHDTIKVGELSQTQVLDLTAHLDSMKLENHLRRQIQQDIQRLRDTGTYRGRRHAMNLPVRGQNTRSQIKNARKLNKVERF
ncbi:30S ribosomal protein S13 [Exophiala sideris]|uniref:30S ribosomal protein S13 n=1 Tax=Exophiala sideris TaxID=1016849 RepID=A0A0D1VR13_9EURO|nr:30S ribosomal protein S13 [Exophiala sideris]